MCNREFFNLAKVRIEKKNFHVRVSDIKAAES